MQIKDKCREIQAIVFASGEPVEVGRIAEATEISGEEALALINDINVSYREWGLPFEIAVLSGAAQMCMLPQYVGIVRNALNLKRNVPLSQAALEVLAIVAYNQPVTKAFVEQVRGVDSSGVISSLVEKALVEEAGRLELPGRPISYKTTANFLRCFSLNSLEELPEIDSEEEGAKEDGELPEEELEGQLGFGDEDR